MGSANYSNILPYNSYIDAFNFSSPQHLANYLKIVENDEKLYKSYFEWKNNYCVDRTLQNRNLCQLCRQLNENKFNENTLKNKSLHKWWVNEDNCRSIKFRDKSSDNYELVRP